MDFMAMIQKDYLCKVRVANEYNVVKNYKDFSVDTLTDDENIIRQYCKLTMIVSYLSIP